MREFVADLIGVSDDMVVIDRMNAVIDTMRQYGAHEISVPSRGYKMRWSNGSWRWHPYGGIRSGKVYLDANEFFVMGSSYDKLESIAGELDQLPLAAGSFEAKERGMFSLKDIEIPPGILRAIGTGTLEDNGSAEEVAKKIEEDAKEEENGK